MKDVPSVIMATLPFLVEAVSLVTVIQVEVPVMSVTRKLVSATASQGLLEKTVPSVQLTDTSSSEMSALLNLNFLNIS